MSAENGGRMFRAQEVHMAVNEQRVQALLTALEILEWQAEQSAWTRILVQVARKFTADGDYDRALRAYAEACGSLAKPPRKTVVL